MQIDLSPETLTPWMELAGILGTGLLAFGSMWWKFAVWLKAKEDFQALANEQIKLLLESSKMAGTALNTLTLKIEEREKDLIKLEGALEVQRKDMIGVITSLQKTAGSLDALWRTLETISPEKIRRLSDK